jgi:predicted alternative tryptophan synthase beta-subunit
MGADAADTTTIAAGATTTTTTTAATDTDTALAAAAALAGLVYHSTMVLCVLVRKDMRRKLQQVQQLHLKFVEL